MAKDDITYDSGMFNRSRTQLTNAVVGLQGKSGSISAAGSLGEKYEGSDFVDGAVTQLPNTLKTAEELLSEMQNTMGVMDNLPVFGETPMVAYTTLNSGLMLAQYSYYSNYPALTTCYDIVAPIAGGSAQATGECLGSANTMGNIVMMAKYGLSEEDIVQNNYSFENKDDALAYTVSEIRAGRPVVLQVTGTGAYEKIKASPTPEATIDTSGKGSLNKHFILVFGVNTEVIDGVKQTDLIYLDPAEGEVKQLGIGVDELGLQPRYLIRGEQSSNPLEWNDVAVDYDYYVGTFNGNEPTNCVGNVKKLGGTSQPLTDEVWVSFMANNNPGGINYYRDLSGNYGERIIGENIPYDTENKGKVICSVDNYPWM